MPAFAPDAAFPAAPGGRTVALRADSVGAGAAPSGDVLAAADGTVFRVESVATGLEAPASLDFAPDGRLFVAEEGGRVWVLLPGELRPSWPSRQETPPRGAGSACSNLALDPGFSDNGLVYLLQAGDQPGGAPAGRLVRYREVGNTLAQAAVLLDDLPVAAPPAGAGSASAPTACSTPRWAAAPAGRRSRTPLRMPARSCGSARTAGRRATTPSPRPCTRSAIAIREASTGIP